MSDAFGEEVYWTLVSFLALPAERQLELLPGDVPARDDDAVSDPARNPLLAVACALYDYFPAWFRAFYEADAQGCRLDDEIAEAGAGIWCREALASGEAWPRIRREACEMLAAAGLEPQPVARPLPVFDWLARG